MAYEDVEELVIQTGCYINGKYYAPKSVVKLGGEDKNILLAQGQAVRKK